MTGSQEKCILIVSVSIVIALIWLWLVALTFLDKAGTWVDQLQQEEAVSPPTQHRHSLTTINDSISPGSSAQRSAATRRTGRLGLRAWCHRDAFTIIQATPALSPVGHSLHLMSVSRTLYPLASTYVKCFLVRPRLLTSSYPAFVKCQQITREGKASTGVPIDHRPVSQRHFQTSSRIHGPQKRERNSTESSRGTVGKHATPRKKSKRTNKPDEDVRDPCVMAYKIMSDKFGERYANPFTTYKSGDHEDWEDWGDTARTVVELRMCALSSSIREKQRWYEKIQDPSIRARWREEALSQALPVGSKKEWVLTEKMVCKIISIDTCPC